MKTPRWESGRDPLVRMVPIFLVCSFSLKTNSGMWLTAKNYLNSVRQTLAASAIFFFFFLSGSGRRILQEIDSLKTTHVRILDNSFRSSPSDHSPKDSRNARPVGNCSVSWPVFPLPSCKCSWPLFFGSEGSAGEALWAGQGGSVFYFY